METTTTATWHKTKEWSEYRTTLDDGTTISVFRIYPGQNWFYGQNFYWAWEIDRRPAGGEQHTPGGEYQRTLKECKAKALWMERYERQKAEKWDAIHAAHRLASEAK